MDRFAIAVNCTCASGSIDLIKNAILRILALQEENLQYFFRGVNLGLNLQKTMPDITLIILVDSNKSLNEEKINNIILEQRDISLVFVQRM